MRQIQQLVWRIPGVCKYHAVFAREYWRMIIDNQYGAALREIIRTLYKYKKVEKLKGNLKPTMCAR